VLRQCSPESEDIYDFIVGLHKHFNGDWKKVQKQSEIADEDLESFLGYAAQFLGNAGNYKSFGDSKFIPRIAASKLEAIAKVTPESLKLWEKFKDGIYENQDESYMHLGYPDAGHVSTYYPDSPDITKEEITLVSDFLQSKKLLPENTRIRKTKDGFEVLVASAENNPDSRDRDIPESEWELDGKLSGKKLKMVFGDYSTEMGKIADAIDNAEKHAANDTQISMMKEYSKSFRTGSSEAYKESQRFWIKDKSPEVECDIGFVETYRDPHGIRGEWEGFCSMVNKERTKAFGKLVDAAQSLIPKLPWDKVFEKDKFLAPDFTSLEVLTFAGSGIPAGINIPNFGMITPFHKVLLHVKLIIPQMTFVKIWASKTSL
jgi:dipeptidyl-peptidase-3